MLEVLNTESTVTTVWLAIGKCVFWNRKPCKFKLLILPFKGIYSLLRKLVVKAIAETLTNAYSSLLTNFCDWLSQKC